MPKSILILVVKSKPECLSLASGYPKMEQLKGASLR